MKRKSKPWQSKVDDFCLKYLDLYREARRAMSQATEPQDLGSYVQTANPAEDVFQKNPELRQMKTIRLAPEFVQMLEAIPHLRAMAQEGDHVYPARIADTLEMMQTLLSFPTLPPEVKLNGCFMLSLWIVIGKDLWASMRQSQYGAEPLDEAKVATLAAQFFERLAQLCRGRGPQTKGRHNVELVELVKLIQEHQTEEMSPGDLAQALEAAGVSVPRGETWRIWLWRARRDGLIPKPAGRPQGKRS